MSEIIKECEDCNSIVLTNVQYCYICRQTRDAHLSFVGASFEEYKERLEGKKVA
jgi:hypothetical protein